MNETLVARPLEAPVLEPITPRKPSEALRLGRLYRPVQVTGVMFGDEREACALGAMIIGSGGDADDSYDFLSARHPWLFLKNARCPAAERAMRVCMSAHPLVDLTYHLNDEHLWTDDQIVGWLQGHGE